MSVFDSPFNQVFRNPYGSAFNEGAGGAAAFSPASLFASGEQGAWYDPSDFSTMFQDSAGTTPVTAVEDPVGKILDKSGRGNHATQATTAAKPKLSARENLLTYSEDFSNAVWAKGANAAVTVNTQVAPDGATTADTYTSSGAADALYYIHSGMVASAPYTFSIRLKQGTGRWVKITVGANGYQCWVDTQTATLGTAAAFGTGTLIGATVTALADGWMVVRLSGTIPGTNPYTQLNSVTADAVTTQASGTCYVWGAQFEYGSAATTYQRIAAATDYDTVGFYHYGKLDRVDDNMTAAAGGGGTTGIIVCAAIRAGGAGNARTIWSDRGTNTGYRLSVNASNQLVLSAGNGTAHTEVVGPTITAGTDYVVTGWHDGTNLNVRVNAGATTSAAFGTATAGTAGFTIGKDNGAATGYYGERIYEIVYRKNDASSAGDRTSLITYMAAQAGISL